MGSNDSDLLDVLRDMLEKRYEKKEKPVIPPTRSLNSCEGDQNGDRIEFSFDLAFPLSKFSSMEVDDSIQSFAIPMSHGHVLWSYAANWKRVETDSYEFSLVSLGPHLNQELRKRPDPEVNAPEALKEPEISATMAILGEKGEEVMRMNLPRSLVAPKRFSMLQLIGLSVNNKIPVVIRIVIDRSYFSLANIIDLDEMPTASYFTQEILDVIFLGEKPTCNVWEVVVPEDHHGQGDTSGGQSFYIQRNLIPRAMPAFKDYTGFVSGFSNLIKTSRDAESHLIEITGPDSFEMSTLTTVDMKVIVPLIYGAPVPLPERWEKMSTLVRTLFNLFSSDFLLVLTVQWERAICNAALALDTSDVSDLPAIARLLAIVWAYPYGLMPVAKRVAVGVLADMMHRNGNGRMVDQLRLLTPDFYRALDGHALAMQAVIIHLNAVAMVRKTFLAASKSAAVAAAPIPAATPTAAAARDVVIDVRDVQEKWYDTETIDNKKEEGSKWGCTIS